MARKKKGRNRSRSTIDLLPPIVKATVEQMIVDKAPYREVVEYLKTQDVSLSIDSVRRYADRYMEAVSQLHAAQENFKIIMEETERYPELDTAEVLLRIGSHKLLGAVLSMKDEDLEKVEPSDIIAAINALARATAYKKQVDIRGKSDMEKAKEAYKALLFSTIAKRRPDLYQQIVEVLNEEEAALQEEDDEG